MKAMTYTLEMREQFICSRHPQDVFDYISDFSRIDEWDHTIVEAHKVSDGPIGVGARFALTYTMGLRRVPINYEITEFEAPSRAVLVGRSKTFAATDTITVNEHPQGCEVTWYANIEFHGAAAKIVPMIENRVRKAGMQTIRDLAKALEDKFPVPKLGLTKIAADKLIFPGLLSFTKFGYQHNKKHWRPVTNSVSGQHIVITGATSGLGLASAYELAHRGARLTLVARNEAKAQGVIEQISRRTGNHEIQVEIADLAEITQVKQLAARLLKSATPIDVLINNAGALLNPRQENSDGLETSFALLLLGPVILTESLKPLLGQIADNPSRVINVSSGGMYAKRISTSNIESTRGTYSGADAYARAKRGLVMAGEYWAEHWRDRNIIIHSMHPGWAQTPGVEKSLPEFNRKMQKTLRSPEQGADTIVWLACASEAARCTGLFWLDREPHSTHLSNKTRETAAQRSELFAHLHKVAMRYDVDIELGGD